MNKDRNKVRLTRFLSIALIVAGCMQVAGYFLNSRILRGIGFSYGAAPLPTVFATVKGVEGFSTRHQLLFTNKYGKADSILLDQRLFNQFKGSYFLKNACSIFLAYPHMLKPKQVSGAIAFFLCKKNLAKRFGIRDSISNPSIQIQRTRYGQPETIILRPACKEQ